MANHNTEINKCQTIISSVPCNPRCFISAKKGESILQYPRHDAGNITCLISPEALINLL
jgi:hypothetical protein